LLDTFQYYLNDYYVLPKAVQRYTFYI